MAGPHTRGAPQPRGRREVRLPPQVPRRHARLRAVADQVPHPPPHRRHSVLLRGGAGGEGAAGGVQALGGSREDRGEERRAAAAGPAAAPDGGTEATPRRRQPATCGTHAQAPEPPHPAGPLPAVRVLCVCVFPERLAHVCACVYVCVRVCLCVCVECTACVQQLAVGVPAGDGGRTPDPVVPNPPRQAGCATLLQPVARLCVSPPAGAAHDAPPAAWQQVPRTLRLRCMQWCAPCL